MLENLNQGQILTINPMGVFVNDVPVTHYNGEKIENINNLSRCFTGNIIEFEVMQSDTDGNCVGSIGKPMPAIDGRYLWMRGKSDENIWSDWLFRADYSSVKNGVCLLPRWVIKDAMIMTSKKRPEFSKIMLNNIARHKEMLLTR